MVERRRRCVRAKYLFLKCDQPGAHFGEHRRKTLARRPWLVVVQKRIIKIAAVGQCRRLFTPERQNLSERRQKGGHVLVRARLGPDALGH